MKKSLLLCSTIALLLIAVVSCTKKADSPAPNLTGYYIGKVNIPSFDSDSSTFSIFVKDDNINTSISFIENFFYGSITIKNNTFIGKFYDEITKPVAFIENGTISGTGKNITLKGNLKYDNKIKGFSVNFISEEPQQ